MADSPQKSGDLKLTASPVTSADDASSQALNEALGSSFILVRILMVLLLGALESILRSAGHTGGPGGAAACFGVGWWPGCTGCGSGGRWWPTG